MKTIPCTFISCVAAMLSASAQQAAPAMKMRDAATHDQLALVYRKAAQQDPMRDFQPAKGEDPTLATPVKTIVDNSDVICFNGMATLVPKRAIINLPPSMKDRLAFRPGAKLVGWMDFYAANRGWINTVEVSRVQAEGNEALKEEIAQRIGKSANLVVATFKGGPISMLPLKETAQNNAAPAH